MSFYLFFLCNTAICFKFVHFNTTKKFLIGHDLKNQSENKKEGGSKVLQPKKSANVEF